MGYLIDIPYDYLWIVIVGGISGFFAAMGIGANDVANAFATSVGSKALTIKNAMIIDDGFQNDGMERISKNRYYDYLLVSN